MRVKSESEVAQSCLTLSDPMDCSPPGSSIHGIFQARVLEWGAIAFSMRDPISILTGKKPMYQKDTLGDRISGLYGSCKWLIHAHSFIYLSNVF